MRFNLIVPVAADKPEYRARMPYWMDIHPGGNLFLFEAISGLNLREFDAIYITLLRTHEEKYQVTKALALQFEKIGLAEKLRVVILDAPTGSQPETVAATIEKEKIEGHIVVKDSDNHFECTLRPGNFICTYPLDALNRVNPGDKSYIAVDDNSYITNIVEKKIISRWFCAGAYGFESAELFLDYYHKHKVHKGLYISHLIYAMLLDRINFKPINIRNYCDWGTEREWQDFKNQFQTLLIPVELFFSDSDIVRYVNKLYESNKVNIVLLSARNNIYNGDEIERHLKTTLGLKYHQILTIPQRGNCHLISGKNDLLKLAGD